MKSLINTFENAVLLKHYLTLHRIREFTLPKYDERQYFGYTMAMNEIVNVYCSMNDTNHNVGNLNDSWDEIYLTFSNIATHDRSNGYKLLELCKQVIEMHYTKGAYSIEYIKAHENQIALLNIIYDEYNGE